MKIAELLDRAKHDAGIESDYALAKALGIHKARVSAYYSGKEAPNEWACLRISEITGIPLDTVIATVKAASEKDVERRAVWENYMKRLGGLAASVLITLCVTVTMLVTSTPSEASPTLDFRAGTICIMLNYGQKKDQLRSSSQSGDTNKYPGFPIL